MPPSTPGLAATFFSALFDSLDADFQTRTTEMDASLKAERGQVPCAMSTTGNENASQRQTVVKVGILCSSNGDLTDVAALCSNFSYGGMQRADVLQTSPGIRQFMVPVASYTDAIGLCMAVRENLAQSNIL